MNDRRIVVKKYDEYQCISGRMGNSAIRENPGKPPFGGYTPVCASTANTRAP